MYVFELELGLYYKPKRNNNFQYISTDGIQWQPSMHKLQLGFDTTTVLSDAILQDYEGVSIDDNFVKKLFPDARKRIVNMQIQLE